MHELTAVATNSKRPTKSLYSTYRVNSNEPFCRQSDIFVTNSTQAVTFSSFYSLMQGIFL